MINWTGDEEESRPSRRSSQNTVEALDIAREHGACDVVDAQGEVMSVISIPRNPLPTEDSLLEEIAELKILLAQAQQERDDANAKVLEWQRWLSDGCDGDTLTKMGEMRVQIRKLERDAVANDESFDALNDEACGMFRALHRILEPDGPDNTNWGLNNLFKEARGLTTMAVEDLQRERGRTDAAKAAEYFARGAALRQSREEGPVADDEMILSIDGNPPERSPVTQRRLYCTICYKPQYRTPHGVVCTNGHGGAPGSVKDA